jgi:hypothetical protein
VRAAGADDPLRLDGLLRPVGPLQRHEQPVVARHQGRRRDAALDDAPELREPIGEDPLRAPLRRAALDLPRAADPGEAHLPHRPQVRIEHPRETQMDRGGEHRVEDLRPTENLQRPRLQLSGTRLAVRLGPALHDPGRHAVARELGRGEQARRSRADHEHLGVSLAHGAN